MDVPYGIVEWSNQPFTRLLNGRFTQRAQNNNVSFLPYLCSLTVVCNTVIPLTSKSRNTLVLFLFYKAIPWTTSTSTRSKSVTTYEQLSLSHFEKRGKFLTLCSLKGSLCTEGEMYSSKLCVHISPPPSLTSILLYIVCNAKRKILLCWW